MSFAEKYVSFEQTLLNSYLKFSFIFSEHIAESFVQSEFVKLTGAPDKKRKQK